MACLDWWNVQRPRLRHAASSSSACLLLMQIGLLSVGQHVLSNILSLKLSNSVGSCASEKCSPWTFCCLHRSCPHVTFFSHDARFILHLHSCISAAKLVCRHEECQVLNDRQHDHVQSACMYLLLTTCGTCSPFHLSSYLMLAADRVL